MRLLLAMLGLLWVVNAGAQATGGWYTTTIKYVYAGQAGGRVAVAVNEVSFAACSGSREFIIDQSNPYFKQMLMMIMTAYVTGKSINLFTTGQCVFNGASNGVLLTDVWLLM